MTHAESQDLLIDLAYGELDAARAAELESHLAQCADCRREKSALDQARSAAAPLRELEEPPPGFDDRILEAARAQAQLEHGGNIGQVIEVQGNVRPLGLEAARIDAHGKPPVQERRRPRWALRAVLGGSVAAAAALALVVSTTLQSRHEQERAVQSAAEKNFEIRIQPAMKQAADEAIHEAKKEEPQPVAPPPRDAAPDLRSGRIERKSRPGLASPAPVAAEEGSGGDAPLALNGAPPSALAGKSAASGTSMPTVRQEESPGTFAHSPAAVPEASVVAAQAAPPMSQPAESPADLERLAEQARHAGDYANAAGLYRQASAIRRAAGERSGSAAWDLAHAIECLAAIGQFEEASQVRNSLAALYPDDKTAFSAASRALREVDVPAAKAKADQQ